MPAFPAARLYLNPGESLSVSCSLIPVPTPHTDARRCDDHRGARRIVLAELALHSPPQLLPGELHLRRVHDGRL